MSNMTGYLKFAGSLVFRQCVRDENLELKNSTFRQIWSISSALDDVFLILGHTAHENLDLCWIRKLLNLGYMPFLDKLELKRVDFYSKIHRMLAFRISKYISILNGLSTSCSEVLELGSISLESRCGVSVKNGQFFK
ncbi:hypothetical protein RCL_jg16053.t1 [Rhizophagus clarus]|uniref:Uncharacterized protein n=1 Tax=Rhizophagus clarus TaxID=94130 RepID=A0A8H3L7N8_9GLOM|nr:hypothetical protein RCL_jg16053.t1 [Rhizophagus clarus]